MKISNKETELTTIVKTGFDLLQSDALYGQNSIVAKLKFLGYQVSTATLSNLLAMKTDPKRKVGPKVLAVAAKGMEQLMRHELDMAFNPENSTYAPLHTPDWMPYRVPDAAKINSPDFSIHSNGRVSLEHKTAFIGGATKEVIELGLRLNAFAGYFTSQNEQAYKAHIIKMLRRGVHFKGYLIDPASEEAKLYFKDRSKQLKSEQEDLFETSNVIRRLKILCEEFDAMDLKGKFEIFKYQHIPFGFIYVVDPGLPTGKMMVSPYLYGVRRANCPVLEFTKSNQPVMFKKYMESLQCFVEGAVKI
jgi:hypothetical protein